MFFFIFIFSLAATAERLPVKTYTVADGLQRDLVSRIRQDSRGFLWFCTGEGISRFDGVGMTNFTVSDGLPNRVVNDFLETKNGTIYIATGKGLARLNPRGSKGNSLFTTFLPENPKSEKILVLYQDLKNQIWVGTSDGLYKLVETDVSVSFEPVTLGESLEGFGGAVFVPNPNTLYINAILETKNGALWIGTFGSGLFRLSPNGAVKRFHADADGFGDNKITALMETRDGRLWMGMRNDEEGGVCILDAEATEKPVRNCFLTRDGLPANRIRDLFESGDGVVWLATTGGLCRWNEGGEKVCKTYTEKNDLCEDVYTIVEDKDGNLWTGSTCGAKKIARYGFTNYTDADGLDKNQVNAMFENSKGELFATSFPKNGRVISRFDGEKFTSLTLNLPDYVNYHGYGWQQTVWQDSRGAWWIPTGYALFRSPDNTSFENLGNAPLEKQETGAKGIEAFRVFEDSRGDIWMATTGFYNELFRWDRARNVWQDLSAETGISASRIGTAFEEDRHGNVWIGASSDYGDGALIRYRNGEFRIFTRTQGAPSGWTSDLFLDSRGRLWIATNENGLLRLDDTNANQPEFIEYTPADGLTSLTTNCVTEDEFGRIYIGTWRGIDRLTPETGQVENFSTAAGLSGGYIESAYRDRRNDLWFMTGKVLARFQPEPVRPRQPPNILITGLRVNGETQTVSILGETTVPALDLNSDKRQITVDFLGLGTSLGEDLHYEYRLNEADWTATDERTVNFANLSSGEYKFEVRAAAAEKNYSLQPAVVNFRIAAPVWRRWWFVAGMLALTVLLIYTFYRYRLNKLLEIERTRTRIATDLHDDIGANLSKISLLSDIVNMQMEGGNSDSKRMLTTIAEVSRSSVASMRDIVWAINPHRDSVLEMTRKMRQYAEETFVPNNISLKFDAPEDGANTRLSMDVRRELFLIFKEAVNNAARHSDCSRIEIEFRVSHGRIFLQIADNGRGFDVADEFDGNGLSNIKTRAEKIGGRFEIESAPGRGTLVQINI